MKADDVDMSERHASSSYAVPISVDYIINLRRQAEDPSTLIALHVNRIAAIVKSLQGDVTGDFLRDQVVCGIPYVYCHSMGCRVKLGSDKTLLSILAIDYEMHRASPFVYRLKCKYSNRELPPIEIEVCDKRDWMMQANVDLDILSLATDDNGVYVRQVPAFFYLPDKINFVMQRVKARRFSLCRLPLSALDMQCVLTRSVALLSRGWTMDDALLGPKAWVACTYSNILTQPSGLRFDHAVASKMARCETCAICHENFENDDVVVNLWCGHTFHVCCNAKRVEALVKATSTHLDPSNSNSNSSRSGILGWLSTDNWSCPCCRSKCPCF